MKKMMFISVIALTSLTASSQQFYTSLSVGYGMGLPGERLGSATQFGSTATPESVTNIYGTFGQGLGINVTPGYSLNDHFGLELGLGYFMGAKVIANEVYTPNANSTVTVNSNQLRLSPSVVIRTGSDGFYGYGKIGLVVPATGTTFTKVVDSGTGGSGTDYQQSFETKGAISLGFTGAIGANYTLSDKLSLFGEASGVNLRINAKSRSMTEYSINGTDVLGSLNTYSKETNYEDGVTNTSNNATYNSSTDVNQPKDDFRTRNNFGGIFINIGLKFNF